MKLQGAVLVVVMGASSMQANAGIWDTITGFFGSSDEEVATEAAPAAEKSGSTLMNTGMQLLPLLTQQLGVSGDQAKGGMGALLQAAQILMSGGDFSQLTKMIPGATGMMSSVPSAGAGDAGGMAGSLMDMASEKSDTVKAGTQLVSQFKSLGMGADMIPKFTGVAEGYLKKSDDPGTADLLTSALSGIMP